MRIATRFVLLSSALLAVTTVAPAYYYWIFFQSADGSGGPVAARYDLSRLSNNTVQYFISDQGPSALAAGDTQTGLFSQIQQAASVWNGVPASTVRLQFGGVGRIGMPQATPGIDVVFDDDMPPGILAQTIPTFPADLKPGKDPAAFVPILRAKVQLRSDLASQQQASYSDSFFLTLVHEFGHALGLQHTLTSGVMSTAITRATMRGAPLSADDAAGISQLYPATSFPAATGSIAGHVSFKNGAGVNLASVVALSSNGVAISGMTNPDGSYRIDGVPAGSYYIYAHPLPPALTGEQAPANIIAPADAAGDDFSAQTGFGTLFYPGTTDWTKAKQVGVASKSTTVKVDITVTARSGPALSSMETYGYENNVAVASPPFVSKTRSSLVFHAYGATVNQGKQMATGLAVSVIGNAAAVTAGSLRYYSDGFLLITVDTGDLAAPTPAALAATLNGDLYVLPAAFTVVPSAPPIVTSLAQGADAQGNLLATISGTGLGATTQILVDGVAATLKGTRDDGSMVVAMPPAPSGHMATIEAVNPDGQTSLQALATDSASSRPLYSFPLHDPASAAISPHNANAGQDLWVAVSGTGTHFADGKTQVGFGTSDISVIHGWVAAPNLMFLNLHVGPDVPAGPVSLNISTGLETIHMADAFSVAPAANGQVSLQLPVVDAASGLPAVAPGGTAVISINGLSAAQIANSSTWTLSVAGEAVPFQIGPNGMLVAQLPADLTVGPKVVQLTVPGAAPIAPVIAQLDSPPPIVLGAATTGYAINSAAAPAHPGDTILVWVYRLGDSSGTLPALNDIWFNAGPLNAADSSHTGIKYPVQTILPPSKDTPTLSVVQMTLPADFNLDPTAAPVKLPLRIGTGNRLSDAFSLYIVAAPPPLP